MKKYSILIKDELNVSFHPRYEGRQNYSHIDNYVNKNQSYIITFIENNIYYLKKVLTK